MKHTLAPWNIHPHYTEIKPLAVIQEDGTGFVAWTTYVARGTKIIAEVRGYSTNAGYENVDNQFEVEANARLIASAPELLDVLKDLIYDLETVDSFALNETVRPIWEDIDRAKAIIAKVEGA